MNGKAIHHHTCACGLRFPCSGQWERNYDGWPEVICTHYHVMDWRRCERCLERCLEQAEEDQA